MKVLACGIIARVSSLVVILALAFLTPTFAQTPAKSLKDQLVGHWKLVSVTIDTRMPYGADPPGSLFIDAGGHFSVIVISKGDARSVSYFGTYTISDTDNSATIHIEGSSGSGTDVAGKDFKRLIRVNGDELIVANETSNGTPGNVNLTWKRAN